MPHSYHGLQPFDLERFDEDFLIELIYDDAAPRSLRRAAIDLVSRAVLLELFDNDAFLRLNDRIYLGHAIVRLIEEVAERDQEIQMVWTRGIDGLPRIKRVIFYEDRRRRDVPDR